MRYIVYKGEKIYHGDEISGFIGGLEVKGKLSINKSDERTERAEIAFFCQNVRDGSVATDKLGFEYSWEFQVLRDGSLGQGVDIYSHKTTGFNSSKVKSMSETAMSEVASVVEFAKNLLLSKEEKLLRAAGLKDSCGEYTSSASELVMQKLMKENEEYLVGIAKKLEDSKKK